MTVVLSIDVGIKNLAFCLLDIKSVTEFQMIDWDVININKDLNDLFWIKNNYMTLNKEDLTEFCSLNKIQYNKETKKCMQEEIKKFLKKMKVKTVKIDYEKTVHNLNRILNERFFKDDLKIDVVVIENQPVLKNPVMKNIQFILYTLFVLKKTKCVFINASEKLKFCKNIGRIDKIPKTYKERKKCSIHEALYLISNNKNLLEIFNKHNKQDDLSDTLLQALAYFHSNNP